MISHKHKSIFIHISKCAGTSVENAFGVPKKMTPPNYDMLYGWSEKHSLHLQHATPEQLLSKKLITEAQWSDYFTFIIVRNPYSRAYSDYHWVMANSGVYGSFKDFIMAKGPFKALLTQRNINYMGDHLWSQYDYFHIQGKRISYDRVIRLESLATEAPNLAETIGLPKNTFSKKANVASKKLSHYSIFYTEKRKRLVEKYYKKDLDFLGYQFEDRRASTQTFLENSKLLFQPKAKLYFRLKYPYLAHRWGEWKRKWIPRRK
ncbi:sulfotransferase family protein [Flavobacteriaceae bacterium TK19130]|nr:sulfotransferase family protein [Thermobacterium salinum]